MSEIMVRNVVTIPGDMQLYEVIRRFKEEQDIGWVIVIEDEKPIVIFTHSDIIRMFPTL